MLRRTFIALLFTPTAPKPLSLGQRAAMTMNINEAFNQAMLDAMIN